LLAVTVELVNPGQPWSNLVQPSCASKSWAKSNWSSLVKLGLTAILLQVFAKFDTSMEHHALLQYYCLGTCNIWSKSNWSTLGQAWFDRLLGLTAICLQVFAKFDTSMEQLEPLSAELNVKALPVFRFYKVRHCVCLLYRFGVTDNVVAIGHCVCTAGGQLALSAELNVKALPVFSFYKVRTFGRLAGILQCIYPC
jgi:hypothetical protein